MPAREHIRSKVFGSHQQGLHLLYACETPRWRFAERSSQNILTGTAASVVIIMVTLLSMADARRSGEFVFTHYDASASGWPAGWSFFVGLLQAAYTLTGYGMVRFPSSLRSTAVSGLADPARWLRCVKRFRTRSGKSPELWCCL